MGGGGADDGFALYLHFSSCGEPQQLKEREGNTAVESLAPATAQP